RARRRIRDGRSEKATERDSGSGRESARSAARLRVRPALRAGADRMLGRDAAACGSSAKPALALHTLGHAVKALWVSLSSFPGYFLSSFPRKRESSVVRSSRKTL